MSSLTFDTLKLAQRLRDEAKYTPEQAESTASVLSDTLAEWRELQELATKSDINILRADIEKQTNELKTGISTLHVKIEGNIRELELRLKVQIGTMIFALGGVLIAVKYFGHG
jgi:hypothetical protein